MSEAQSGPNVNGVPLPIAPTSITVSPSSVIGSLAPITVTVTFTDPCNVGGFVDVFVTGFPPGFNGGGGGGTFDLAPGTGSASLVTGAAYDPDQTLNLTVTAAQNTGLQVPVQVSTVL